MRLLVTGLLHSFNRAQIFFSNSIQFQFKFGLIFSNSIQTVSQIFQFNSNSMYFLSIPIQFWFAILDALGSYWRNCILFPNCPYYLRLLCMYNILSWHMETDFSNKIWLSLATCTLILVFSCAPIKKITVNASIHDDVIKWKHFPRYWPSVRGIHRSPVNSPYKGQWRGALMVTLICARTNGWVNNREAGDLRRHRAHSDVIVMFSSDFMENPLTNSLAIPLRK